MLNEKSLVRVVPKLLHKDGQTDERRDGHGEANRYLFLAFRSERARK
jgi:hypothetical protein